ncbi:transcription/translation regulatory transformer protein RfaH [Proteobacteria bacterium 005FR1]|nr:transcription/translation regulatory transformer protein RfaH [Proteobacteria bacterium 005FR1]
MWYLLKTKPRQEFRAKEHLENQSFETYLPILTRKDKRVEPLFPGYVFIAATADQGAVGAVRSTRGVIGFVRFGAEIATASQDLISGIQDLEHRFQGLSRFHRGQEVMCKSGPFAGLKAIYQAETGEERCVVLLNLLNSPRPVQLKASDLQAV